MTLRLSRSFLGTASIERECEGFKIALRRATVPPDVVPEHGHETAHLILAIDDGYVSDAIGAASWRGPSMLVYNPPGTLHRDRFARTGGRFLSIDVPAGAEPEGLRDPVVLQTGAARSTARAVMRAILCGASHLELEDELLGLSAALANSGERSPAAPTFMRVAAEAIADLAGNAELRVCDVARLVGVHPVHLARVFRKHLGCSPGAAIRQARLDRAASSLASGQSITRIAAEHGFADHAHLTRCFRMAYGVAPSVFRSAFK